MAGLGTGNDAQLDCVLEPAELRLTVPQIDSTPRIRISAIGQIGL